MAFFSFSYGIEARDFNHILWCSLFLVYSFSNIHRFSWFLIIPLGLLTFCSLFWCHPGHLGVCSHGEFWEMAGRLHCTVLASSYPLWLAGFLAIGIFWILGSWSSSLISLGVSSPGLACSVSGSLRGFCVYGPLFGLNIERGFGVFT
jgi:hypothetical protein